jgi:hypothetical protein
LLLLLLVLVMQKDISRISTVDMILALVVKGRRVGQACWGLGIIL